MQFNVIISKHWFILSAVISNRKDLLFLERINFSVSEGPSPSGRHKIEITAVNVTSVQSINKCFFSDNNHILKFFIKGFKNSPSSFFLILKICYQVLTSAQEVSFRHSKQRWQVIMVLLLHLKEITWKRTVYLFFLFIFFNYYFSYH